VEWVETTGKTVEEAKEAALDQLGVDESEAEFEVLEEPKSGLFGRVRREARVRARVEPTRPRPKADRRERRRKPAKGSNGGGGSGAKAGRGAGNGRSNRGRSADSNGSSTPASTGATASRQASGASRANGGRGRSTAATTPAVVATADTELAEVDAGSPVAAPADDRPPRPAAPARRPAADRPEREPMSSDLVSMDEQADIIEDFLTGLTDAFGVQPEIRRETIDDEMLELQIDAPDLGLLIGPKGQTLAAVQELARTVLQRKATGTYDGRVRIDIAGYRSRRRQALEKFTIGVADQVRASGTAKVLEPMSPPDRKVVHDTVNDLDGVVTASEGTEPYRRVVIKPA
jgi:spoIIIJ-associated protein